MANNFTANILKVLAAKKKTPDANINPMQVTMKLPTSRVPKGNSIVSFKYLLKNAIRYQPDEANSEHVELRSLRKVTFKNGAKGVVTTTLTDLPQYNKPHKWEQVIRCTPADYTGKIVDCPGIVFNCNCLVGDTKVLTDEGWKTIYEIAEPISDDLPINYIVHGKVYPGSAPFFTGNKRVWEIKLENSMSLTATSEHRVRVHISTKYKTKFESKNGNKKYLGCERKDEYAWKAIKDLKEGDKVVINNYTPPKIEKTKEFYESYFVGVMMGDGSMFNTGFPNLVLNNTDKVTYILPKLEKIGVVKSTADKETETQKTSRINLNHRATEILDRYKYENKVSVKELNFTAFLGYLNGLIDTDGYVGERLWIYGDITYLQYVFDELIRYGYSHCSLHICNRKGQKTNKGVRNKDLWAIEIGVTTVRQIFPNLSLRKFHMKKLKKLMAREENIKIPCSKVVSIDTNRGNQPVYDITVPGKSRFIANGMVVHNCPRNTFVWNWVLWSKSAAVLNATNEPPDITNPRRLLGTCIAEGQYVSTKRGSIPIEDVTLNDKVWTKDGWKKVIGTAYKGKKHVVKITSNTGQELICTPDHLILVLTEKGEQWVEAKDLKENNYLCVTFPKETDYKKKPIIKLLSAIRIFPFNKKPLVKFDRVVSVKSLKSTKKVYDLTVAGNEQFTVNGITVHNCKHGIIAMQAIKKRGL
jgi:intein/homing endonuclease